MNANSHPSALASFWSFLGRNKLGLVPGALRQSARRKFSRSQRGNLIVCDTRPGFRLECRIGDPLDNLVYFDGEFEPELRLFLDQHGGSFSTIVDVGCNIGYVSCLLAARHPSARIVSLDANPEMIRRCEANLKLNGFRAETVCCALGEREELRSFHVPKNRPSYASFGHLEHECDRIEVPVRRLDQLLREKGIEQIDLLKIDVEGFEPPVLNGLGTLPVKNICLEFSPANLKNCGFTPDDLWNRPLWKGYRLFLLENGTGNPLAFQPGRIPDNATDTAWARAET
jgi:FkbM family methyltransferase